MWGKYCQNSEKECGSYDGSKTRRICPPMRNITHPLRYYEFTPDELKALEECDKESFYQRCLPFSTLFAATTYAAIKYGLLAKSKDWGMFPKLAMAILAGHVLGRLAYIPQCEQKFRELPASSYLYQVMKKHHDARNPPPPKK